MIRAHLLRWRPRQPAQRTASTPRRLPSGAASQLDPSPRSSRFLQQAAKETIRAHLRRYGALDSRLNVQKVRLAGCLRAPPRSWTLLLALAGFSNRLLKRRFGPICFVGALDRRLNVQKVRLAGCLRAPPRSWTLLLALAGFLRQAPRATIGPICFVGALDRTLQRGSLTLARTSGSARLASGCG